MTGYMYILKCSDDSYYTGSTRFLYKRLQQHQTGEGANHTRKNLPVELVYWEEYDRIDTAFYREKQVQGWSRKKKEALINGEFELLSELAECINSSHSKNFKSLPSTPQHKPLPSAPQHKPLPSTPLSQRFVYSKRG
jgi:predicted GIY-YIG superfamily endonuclease